MLAILAMLALKGALRVAPLLPSPPLRAAALDFQAGTGKRLFGRTRKLPRSKPDPGTVLVRFRCEALRNETSA